MKEVKLKDKTVRLLQGDITALDVEAIVYYAAPDLKLGTGFGAAIAMRGGPAVQKELDALGKASVGQVVATGAGNLKAKTIFHAVGPRFQEPETEKKLRQTIRGCLDLAAGKGVKQLAFPPMGAGFYGVPLDECARIMLDTFKEYATKDSPVKELIISANDRREYQPFAARLDALS